MSKMLCNIQKKNKHRPGLSWLNDTVDSVVIAGPVVGEDTFPSHTKYITAIIKDNILTVLMDWKLLKMRRHGQQPQTTVTKQEYGKHIEQVFRFRLVSSKGYLVNRAAYFCVQSKHEYSR